LAYLRGEIKREHLAEAIQVSTGNLLPSKENGFVNIIITDQLLIPVNGEGVSLSELVWHSDT
jgi:hypothetical protein